MTTIQQVLFDLETHYMGHPYFVTGNAIYSALARRLPADTCQSVQVSHGMFVPGEYGSYPPEHSRSGGVPYMGASLRPVESLTDLYLFRDPANRWLSDTRPREAHNTVDIHSHGGRLAMAPATRFGRPPDAHHTKRTVNWRVYCYLHADGEGSPIPLDDTTLEGIRVGGARNYGCGELSVADTQTVDLQTLETTRLEEAADSDHGFQLELCTPYVRSSTHPDADDQQVPWWWGDTDDLRQRRTRLIKGSDCYELETVDHGQVVTYTGDQPIKTAINGIRRVGTHSKFGFGEFRLRPASADRVPDRQERTTTQ
jgi:hypothetical protein